MYKVISKDTLLEARKNVTEKVEYIAPTGEIKTVEKRIVNGEMEVFELAKPIGEMLTTPAGLEDLVRKTVIDIEAGREQIPLLYKPIYRTIEDRNFSKHVEIAPLQRAQIVFLKHLEGEEVKFGSRFIGEKETVPIETYAAAIQWTEDMREYDSTWEMTEVNRAIGEAYNALLNHLHLYPIISYNYPAKNKTAAVTSYGSLLENIRATIRQGLIDAAKDKNPDTLRSRRPTILLAHPSRQMDIEEALQRMQIGGTVYPALSQIDTLIFYDGHELVVGDKVYSYPGVDPNKAYLIDRGAGRYFVELIKHDLRVDAGGADITRLVEDAVVARARRGLYAAPEAAVQELTLPS